MDTSGILSPKIDKSQIPPLHQKRILAFVNHFLINSCSFLNSFAEKCEYKFIEVERKLQKVEAGLSIIEAKISSIPNVEPLDITKSQPSDGINTIVTEKTTTEVNMALTTEDNKSVGIMACDDARYKTFFKMIQVGVPQTAVKLKMKAVGLDPSIIEQPNAILADGTKE